MAQKKKQTKKGCKKGFTIIEVVLVLAIAGLIFLMVFIALPALQRAQRNTQREDDLSRFLTAVTEYQSNNSGRLPFEIPGNGPASPVTQANLTMNARFVDRYIDSSCAQAGWAGALSNSSALTGTVGTCDPTMGSGDQFTDPDGTVYSFVNAVIQDNAGVIEVTNLLDQNVNINHGIYVVVGYVCGPQERTLRRGTGNRQLALLMNLEGGGVTCNDNQ